MGDTPQIGKISDLHESQNKLVYLLLSSLGTKLNFKGMIDVFYDGYHLSESYYSNENELLLQAIDEIVFSGGTLRIRSVERYFSSLRSACLRATDALSGHVWMNLYLSRSKSKGLGRHTDKHSVFAVQLSGLKKWKSWTSNTKLPASCVLTPGDFIFMPHGVPHLAENRSPLSLHIAVGLPAGFKAQDVQVVKDIVADAVLSLLQERIGYEGMGNSFPLVLGLSIIDKLLRSDDFVCDASTKIKLDSLPAQQLNQKPSSARVEQALLKTVHDRSMKVSTFVEAVDEEEPLALLLSLWNRKLICIKRSDGEDVNLQTSMKRLLR